MKHRPFIDSLAGPKSSTDSRTNAVERRSAVRKPVIASAQVVEAGSGARLRARSCDLVVQGCYIDTINPFPAGTLVRIRLEKEGAKVDSKGKVVYRLPGLGMGIAFLDLTPENQRVLEQWLALSGTNEDPFQASLSAFATELESPLDAQSPTLIVELIQLLHQRGIINKADANKLLRLPFD